MSAETDARSRRPLRTLAAAALVATLVVVAQGPALLAVAVRAEQAWMGMGTSAAPVVCAYRARTGRPCLGCGGTRAFALAVRGDWLAAVDSNPLGAWAGATAWAAALFWMGVLFAGRVPPWRVPVTLLVGTGTGALLVTVFWWWLRA